MLDPLLSHSPCFGHSKCWKQLCVMMIPTSSSTSGTRGCHHWRPYKMTKLTSWLLTVFSVVCPMKCSPSFIVLCLIWLCHCILPLQWFYMGIMASQITSSSTVFSTVVSANIKGIIKAKNDCPLVRGTTSDWMNALWKYWGQCLYIMVLSCSL